MTNMTNNIYNKIINNNYIKIIKISINIIKIIKVSNTSLVWTSQTKLYRAWAIVYYTYTHAGTLE